MWGGCGRGGGVGVGGVPGDAGIVLFLFSAQSGHGDGAVGAQAVAVQVGWLAAHAAQAVHLMPG